jgi:hypothetical protein
MSRLHASGWLGDILIDQNSDHIEQSIDLNQSPNYLFSVADIGDFPEISIQRWTSQWFSTPRKVITG